MDMEYKTLEYMPRKIYTTEFLKSFSGTESCRSPPPNIDLREINSEVSVEETVPEWRRRASTPSPTGKNGQRRKNRLSHSLSGSYRSKLDGNIVSTFPTKNRVNTKPETSSVKLERSQKIIELQGPRHPRNKLLDSRIKLDVSPVLTSDSEQSIASPDQKIDLGTLFVMEKNQVLPMPAAPTLEEIEKDMKVADFVTCQDVEKIILSTGSEALVASSNPGSSQWPEDKAAFKQILLLLQGNQSAGQAAVSFKQQEEETTKTCWSDPAVPAVSTLVEMLKGYERAASKLDQANRAPKSRIVHTDTIDSVRTTVKQSSDDLATRNSSIRTTPHLPKNAIKPHPVVPGPVPGLLRSPPPLTFSTVATPPNTFLHTRPVAVGMAETPLVPQALQALQKLVDHQLHILNSIPGEVTPGMLHQRLTRSVLGYPATGTHVFLATTCAPAYGFGVNI